MKPNWIKESEFYAYDKRSCETCSSWKECQDIHCWDWRMTWLNLAQCGCIKFHNPDPEIMAEPRKKRKCDENRG